MAENDSEAGGKEIKIPSLADSIVRIRENQADRTDVVIEMAQAARARLELLAQDLEPVFREVPDDIELFEFSLSGGSDARLWIDMTSFVRMGRDRRQYEFVKDTRLGRRLVGSTPDRYKIAEMVADYIAERLLDREYTIEGDWQALKLRQTAEATADRPNSPISQVSARTQVQPTFPAFLPLQTNTTRGLWLTVLFSVLLFSAGFLIGAAALIVWAWFGKA